MCGNGGKFFRIIFRNEVEVRRFEIQVIFEKADTVGRFDPAFYARDELFAFRRHAEHFIRCGEENARNGSFIVAVHIFAQRIDIIRRHRFVPREHVNAERAAVYAAVRVGRPLFQNAEQIVKKHVGDVIAVFACVG